MQFYDPNNLVTEVQDLLESRGLNVRITDYAAAQIGASSLLRSLGIMPATDAVEAYARTDQAGSWAEADDRR
jgi:hypothetical protein